MATQAIRATGDGVWVDTLVVPNASQSHVVGLHGDRIRIRISSPPEKGKANKELLAVLLDATGAQSAAVVSGDRSRHKTVALTGLTVAAVRKRLLGDV